MSADDVMKDIVRFLREHDRFLIATHLNPDGDALGSALALAIGLETIGKRAVVYDRDGVPETYRFLPKWESVTTEIPDDCCASWPLVLVDCNSPARVGLEDGVSYGPMAIIDHHETESNTQAVRWIDPMAPAAGMMVYHVLKGLDIRFTPDMATNLYAAISVDTGMFRYPNTTADTLRVGADLIEAGAKPFAVASGLYESWSRNRFALFRLSIDSIETWGDAALMVITQQMMSETGTTQSETENFVNYPLLIKDVKVSVFLREAKEGTWKASLRSKGKVNAARIAERFSGGGHRNAAGCSLTGTLDEVKKAILEAVGEWVSTGGGQSAGDEAR